MQPCSAPGGLGLVEAWHPAFWAPTSRPRMSNNVSCDQNINTLSPGCTSGIDTTRQYFESQFVDPSALDPDGDLARKV